MNNAAQVLQKSADRTSWLDIKATLKPNSYDFIYYNRSSSMTPEIEDGDKLFCKVVNRIDQNGTYLFLMGNEYLVMRAERTRNQKIHLGNRSSDRIMWIQNSDIGKSIKMVARVVAHGADDDGWVIPKMMQS